MPWNCQIFSSVFYINESQYSTINSDVHISFKKIIFVAQLLQVVFQGYRMKHKQRLAKADQVDGVDYISFKLRVSKIIMDTEC